MFTLYIWVNLNFVLKMHPNLATFRVGNEAACSTAVQESASVPERVESWHFGQTLQPSSNMSGCLQVSRPRHMHAVVWWELLSTLSRFWHLLFSAENCRPCQRTLWCECCSWTSRSPRQPCHYGSTKTIRSELSFMWEIEETIDISIKLKDFKDDQSLFLIEANSVYPAIHT